MTIAQQVVILAAALAFGCVAVWLDRIPKQDISTPKVILMNFAMCTAGIIAIGAFLALFG